ncbi:PREDICTED: uncharacterized protein LOC105571092 [Vollenhovia emeryi]|uniref:uncharacterized protein LOC105571092 n=1 Tax=Vollenhovia emeryi TaxID=411798 RepID=UPI0005F4B86F|nr:PREDICTED: uncharacterized protein LOC105571092 [Vollenhovia emeryi]
MRVEHIEKRVQQQFPLIDVIVKSYDNLVENSLINNSNQRINACLSSLKETWEKFSLNHEAIKLSITKLSTEDKLTIYNHAYFVENLFSDTHVCYLESLERITSMLESDQLSTTASVSTQSLSQPLSSTAFVQHTRLPRITIPTFNGTPSEWLSFKDLFTSIVINNPSVSAVEKLQYLKTNLVGSAALLIKDTVLIADNFQKTWDVLVSFYENKRVLVHSELQSLFTLKRITKESAAELEQLYSKIGQAYRTLQSLGRPVDQWDDVLVYTATQRLDAESLKAWQNKLGSAKDPPSWAQFSEFLFSRILALQAYEKSHHGKFIQQTRQQPAKVHFQGKSKDLASNNNSCCVICSEKHFTPNCPQYSNKTVSQKKALIVKHKMCYNCLGLHRVSFCKTTKRCKKCGQKHHTSIHTANVSTNENKKSPEVKENLSSTVTKPEAKVLHSSVKNPLIVSQVLLATAQVVLISENGRITKVRALIDQGSEISIITERVVQRLQLPRSPSSLSLIGIGAQKSNKTRGLTSFTLKPHFDSNIEYLVSAHILPKLTSSIPSTQLDKTSWPHLSELKLADPEFAKPGSIDLILGADIYGQILEEGIVKGASNTPIAQCTRLGWIVSGSTNSKDTTSKVHGYHVTVDEDLYALIRKFWELEEIPTSNITVLSPDEQECENHFKATHMRDLNGRYIVKLPFKESTDKLGNSKTKAAQLVKSLFNRFNAQPDYAKYYTEFINEYENLGHMQRVPGCQVEPERSYYLPHHGVWREQSLTTKLRVVFNGSSLTTSGVSLNQLLHADIEKMYRQIMVHQDNWDYQRILWMNKMNEIIIFVLTTVTYGLACAPFLALRTFNQLIFDEGNRFPLALPTMKKGRYVDDFFGGADTVEEAKAVVSQVDQLCMAGGFNLQKWVSNNPDVLEAIPPSKRIDSLSIQIENTLIHALGLCWQPSTDVFQFTLNLSKPKVISKRTILSTIAKLFDPLGFLSPITISAKIFIQTLWSHKLEWDDQLPPPLSDKWTTFVSQLKDMPSFTFPRWLGFQSSDTLEMHGCSDASQNAIAAVVYIRSTSKEGKVTVTLVASKTKVAPLKKQTIPRLELAGAALLVKLMVQVLQVLEIKGIRVFGWLDSSVAYTWITNPPSRWKEFVQNRVYLIQDQLPQASWGLIPGNENPADLATRGITPSQLLNCSTWWTGPHWLSQHESTWPKVSASLNDNDLEERNKQISTVIIDKSSELWDLIFRYSSLTKLLRITALCRKFVSLLRKCRNSSEEKSLSITDIEREKLYWVKAIQQSFFSQEIKILSQGQSLPKSNPLLCLTSYLDKQGCIRVGGRLEHSQLSEGSKHPLILPKNSVLTTLVIDDSHKRTLHGGTQLTLSFLRQQYWIIRGRTTVKSFIQKCVICTRFRQKRAQQLMGQLPVNRVTPSRAFLNSGIDYAGPFVIKTWKGKNARTYKAYVALFVCFATSALHLELVTDYTSDAFIAAYKRFTARRGICATLTSDCGTNFVGADKELKKLFSESSRELKQIAILLANDGTQWKFHPPSAPHFGGKWEAGVKSVKTHLKRIVGDQLLTYEEMVTFLTQIEAVLNSRPLYPLTDDPDDLTVLTPGHFLIGTAPTVIPEPSLETVKMSHLSRWQLIRKMLEGFWSQWSKEYLQRYHSIYKWNRVAPSLKEGALVLIVDERNPPSKWPLGRIIQTHPGPDGHTRVVTVRTQSSTFKRPIVKICPLPIEINEA